GADGGEEVGAVRRGGWPLAVTLISGIALLAAACGGSGGGGSAPASPSASSTVLKTAFSEDVGSIDPDNNFEVQGLGMILGMYQGLVAYRPGSKQITGLLATSWKVSNND